MNYFIFSIFIFYILYYRFILNKWMMNIYTVFLIYMGLGFYIGILTFDFSKLLVTPFDDSFLEKSILLYTISYFFIVFSILTAESLLKWMHRTRYVKKSNIVYKYIALDVPWGLILIAFLPILVVFLNIYIPIFEDKINISKYFQDRISTFIPYRPYYTLSINMLSVFLLMQLISLYKNNIKIITKISKIFFIIIILIGCGKRGQFFFPLFIFFLSYFMYKKKFLSMFLLFVVIITLGSLLRSSSLSNMFTLSLSDYLDSFSSSFFVSIRELTRLLSFFNEQYLYGLTYLADISSFVPTSINSLKEEYNYMRYITYLSGENPDLFGGMRATYIGEAFINFNIYGVIFISIIFGLFLFTLQRFINRYSLYKSFEYYILLFWSLKMMVLPFFENGSAMFLFFLITLLTFIFVKTIKNLKLRI